MVLSSKGAILAGHGAGAKDAAEDALRGAVQVARGRRARGFELLAAKTYAEFLVSNDRKNEAHELLSETLIGFSFTPSIPVLAAAQTTLKGLA